MAALRSGKETCSRKQAERQRKHVGDSFLSRRACGNDGVWGIIKQAGAEAGSWKPHPRGLPFQGQGRGSEQGMQRGSHLDAPTFHSARVGGPHRGSGRGGPLALGPLACKLQPWRFLSGLQVLWGWVDSANLAALRRGLPWCGFPRLTAPLCAGLPGVAGCGAGLGMRGAPGPVCCT